MNEKMAAKEIALKLRTKQEPKLTSVRQKYGLGNKAREVINWAQEIHAQWMLGHFADPIKAEREW